MRFNYTHNYHSLNFSECPSFKDLLELCNEFYVVQTVDANGGFCIIPELTGNGKINKCVL
jgi:hypothetical protein